MLLWVETRASRVWWHTLSIPALGEQRGGSMQGLHRKTLTEIKIKTETRALSVSGGRSATDYTRVCSLSGRCATEPPPHLLFALPFPKLPRLAVLTT